MAVAVLVLQINLQVGNLYDKTKSVVLGVVAGFILSEEGECPHLAIFLRIEGCYFACVVAFAHCFLNGLDVGVDEIGVVGVEVDKLGCGVGVVIVG